MAGRLRRAVVLSLLALAAACAPAPTPTPTLWPTWTPPPTPALTATPAETPTLTPDAAETFTVRSDLDRVALHVLRIGQGPPLVLAPGGPGDPDAGAFGVGPGFDHTVFRPEMDTLAADFTLIYYDGRGRGASGRLPEPARFRLMDDVADLESVRAALGYDAWAVLGWGYGAAVAQFYARAFPDRVTRLVLLAPMPQRATWDADTAEAAQSTDPHPDTAVDATLARAFLHNDGPDGRPGDARDYRRFLSDIHTETLILWGPGDPAPLAASQEARDLLPNARLVVLMAGGYMPWRHNMPALHSALCDFLAALGCRATP
ncbi:MAG: hypothetical protein Kow00120_17970 [Anaerolineae bacterium]